MDQPRQQANTWDREVINMEQQQGFRFMDLPILVRRMTLDYFVPPDLASAARTHSNVNSLVDQRVWEQSLQNADLDDVLQYARQAGQQMGQPGQNNANTRRIMRIFLNYEKTAAMSDLRRDRYFQSLLPHATQEEIGEMIDAYPKYNDSANKGGHFETILPFADQDNKERIIDGTDNVSEGSGNRLSVYRNIIRSGLTEDNLKKVIGKAPNFTDQELAVKLLKHARKIGTQNNIHEIVRITPFVSQERRQRDILKDVCRPEKPPSVHADQDIIREVIGVARGITNGAWKSQVLQAACPSSNQADDIQAQRNLTEIIRIGTTINDEYQRAEVFDRAIGVADLGNTRRIQQEAPHFTRARHREHFEPIAQQRIYNLSRPEHKKRESSNVSHAPKGTRAYAIDQERLGQRLPPIEPLDPDAEKSTPGLFDGYLSHMKGNDGKDCYQFLGDFSTWPHTERTPKTFARNKIATAVT